MMYVAGERLLRFFARDQAVILLFHSIPSGVLDESTGEEYPILFERVLHCIAQWLTIVPLSELVDRLVAGRSLKGLACITFDDGYLDWVTEVGPCLQELGLPATFFVTTAQLQNVPLWSERIAHALKQSPGLDLRALHASLPSGEWVRQHSNSQVIDAVTAQLKYLKTPFRNFLIERLEAAARVRAAELPCFGVAELRALVKQGFEIGAHTVDHSILSFCDRREAAFEIEAGRQQMQELLGVPIDFFAYPNGKPLADYSSRDVELVRQAGYRGAVTTASGAVGRATSPFQMPRFTPWGVSSFSVLRQLASQYRATTVQVPEGSV